MRILVLHSAYGLRPAVHQAVQRLSAGGHEAHAPDLYGGATADTLEKALALRDAAGRGALMQLALAEVQAYAPDALVGFSLGAALAQRIAVHELAPRLLLLFHSVAEPPERPLPGFRFQVHVADGDAFAPEEELEEWAAACRRVSAQVDIRHYQDAGHLFTDPELPDFSASASASAWDASLRFLESR